MAKKIKTRHEAFPIRSSTHIKEDESNDIFRESIKPWMFKSSVEREYGIDGTVEITKPLSRTPNQIVSGKRFSVQLKSSDVKDFDKPEFSLSVPREKINYWYASIEPVLIVFIDLKSKSCFFRWVDEKLIDELYKTNPNWIAQETVSIKFLKGKAISKLSQLEIERYVLNWKQPIRTILTPGNYFKFSQEAKSYIDMFISKIEKYDVNFLPEEIERLRESTSHAIYTIAIVGPNKAGKSTLINSLLQKSVSPVGMLPTTGIPISIFPSNVNKSIILFKDNTQIEGSVDESFLKEYTSKESNPDNKKGVKIVSVQIVNSLLEKGFAICDVPGLDDPDDEIRQITKTALYHANAIVYLISAAPMANGDFSLTKQIIDDLKELGGRMDRLFLVFNKIDALTDEHINALKKYINSELKRFEINEYLPTAPMYISSLNSFNNRMNNQNVQDSVGDLELVMWEYLLSQNKTGLHKIMGSFGDSIEIIEKLKRIISARLIDTDKRENLETQIEEVSNDISELRNIVTDDKEYILKSLKDYLESSFMNILLYLKDDLNSVRIDNPLPLNVQITNWLENQAYRTISDIYSDLQLHIYNLQSSMNQWISEKLNLVGIETSDSLTHKKMPEINRYTNQISTHYLEKTIGSVGILESLVENVASILINILDSIVDVFTTDTKKRERQKRDILMKSKRIYQKIAKECISNLKVYLNNVCLIMEEKSIDRAKIYLGELSSQITQLDYPITRIEKENFEGFLREIVEIEMGIQSNLTHLKSYTDGIGRS